MKLEPINQTLSGSVAYRFKLWKLLKEYKSEPSEIKALKIISLIKEFFSIYPEGPLFDKFWLKFTAKKEIHPNYYEEILRKILVDCRLD